MSKRNSRQAKSARREERDQRRARVRIDEIPPGWVPPSWVPDEVLEEAARTRQPVMWLCDDPDCPDSHGP